MSELFKAKVSREGKSFVAGRLRSGHTKSLWIVARNIEEALDWANARPDVLEVLKICHVRSVEVSYSRVPPFRVDGL